MSATNVSTTAIVMVGFALPEERMSRMTARDMFPQVQGHRHQWSLVRGLEAATQRSIDLISVAAVGDWPRHPAILVGGYSWSHGGGANDLVLPFINLVGLKQLTRFLGASVGLLAWLWRNRRAEQKVIILYTSQSSQLMALLAATALCSCVKVAVMADPPSMPLPGEGVFRQFARSVDRWVQCAGLRKLDGVVALAPALAEQFAGGVPYLVSEGVAPTLTVTAPRRRGARFIAMYAGGLSRDYGVELILKSVSHLPTDVEIWIYGKGEMGQEIMNLAARDARLVYFGFRPNYEVVNAMMQADLLLNPRSTSSWFVQYSFPSKVLEAMASGTPLLSTRLPSIPKEYEPYVFWLEDVSPIGLSRRIAEIQSLGHEDLLRKGAEAREFVRREKSETAQGERIHKFIQELVRVKRARRQKTINHIC